MKDIIHTDEPSRHNRTEQRREDRAIEQQPRPIPLPAPPTVQPSRHQYEYGDDIEMENRPYSGVINTNARERTAQNLRNNDRSYTAPTLRGTNAITFDDSEILPLVSGGEDVDDPDVPLVVSLTIATYIVNKILVDNGSSSNIIAKRSIDQMNLGRVQY